MNKQCRTGVFDLVDGLKPVDAGLLSEYEREMEKVIDDIIKDVYRRLMLAEESRKRLLYNI